MQVIEDFIEALRRIDGRTSPWNSDYDFSTDLHGDVYYGFNDDVNSFPQVQIIINDERIYSIGGGVRFSNVELQIRCYTYDESVEESGEALASDIEHVISAYRLWAPDIDDFRIASVETDGGINAPYGAAIITAQVLFRR